jgi:hypothetical protein
MKIEEIVSRIEKTDSGFDVYLRIPVKSVEHLVLLLTKSSVTTETDERAATDEKPREETAERSKVQTASDPGKATSSRKKPNDAKKDEEDWDDEDDEEDEEDWDDDEEDEEEEEEEEAKPSAKNAKGKVTEAMLTATKLREVLEILIKEQGFDSKKELLAWCVANKNKVPLLQRIPDLDVRVPRSAELVKPSIQD